MGYLDTPSENVLKDSEWVKIYKSIASNENLTHEQRLEAISNTYGWFKGLGEYWEKGDIAGNIGNISASLARSKEELDANTYNTIAQYLQPRLQKELKGNTAAMQTLVDAGVATMDAMGRVILNVKIEDKTTNGVKAEANMTQQGS